MRSALLLLLAIAPDERALRHYEKTFFEKADPPTPEARRVVDYILQKEHWVGAFSEIAAKFGNFQDDLSLGVDFRHVGGEAAITSGRGRLWKISFNLQRLTELQKQLDELEKLKKEGRQVQFQVPPLKMDRLIYHEMTHVLQAGFDGPGWFVEGMAQMVGDDFNAIHQFIHDKRKVRGLDQAIVDRVETYARGHLFWKWLDTRGATPKTYELAFVRRLPWKQALEQATNRSWENLVADEKEWSESELQRMK